MNRKDHWESVYAQRAEDELSWYQADPRVSFELIRAAGFCHTARIVDVGGGASRLVDRLMQAGHAYLTVLDLSAAALARSRRRLGRRANRVHWIEADILDAGPLGPFDLWHDRAVFHFLTDPEQRGRYVEVMRDSVVAGGQVVLATFGPRGPKQCSGLPVKRYSAEQLRVVLGAGFELLESRSEEHTTPRGAVQDFVYGRFRRH